MSKALSAEVNGYLAEISTSLLCGEREKKKFISRLKNDIEAFLEENPEAQAEDIRAVFGSAEEISRSFMENSDPKAIAKKLRMRKYILAAVATVLIIYALFVVISLIDVHSEAHGYIEEGIMMIYSNIRGGECL